MDAAILIGAIVGCIAALSLAFALARSRDRLRVKEQEVRRAAGSLDEQRRNSDEGRRNPRPRPGVDGGRRPPARRAKGATVFANEALGRHLRDTPTTSGA